jgi:8-oxo-dGTP pyrophosphatase MutT (NUDIX family)
MPDGQLLGPRASGQARQQCAALPVVGGGAAARVVLVTSRETRRWVIPKGWIEPGEAPHRSAAREAYEEAGLVGEAEAVPLGVYAYGKRMRTGHVAPCEVLVFRFRVARLLYDWPERRERTRRLVTPHAAAGLVQEPELALLLRQLSLA